MSVVEEPSPSWWRSAGKTGHLANKPSPSWPVEESRPGSRLTTVLSRESAVSRGYGIPRWQNNERIFSERGRSSCPKKMARCRLPPIRHLAGKCFLKGFDGKQLPGNIELLKLPPRSEPLFVPVRRNTEFTSATRRNQLCHKLPKTVGNRSLPPTRGTIRS